MQSTSDKECLEELTRLTKDVDKFTANMWINRANERLNEVEIVFGNSVHMVNVFYRNAPGDGMGKTDVSHGSHHDHSPDPASGFTQAVKLINRDAHPLVDSLIILIDGKLLETSDPIYINCRGIWCDLLKLDTENCSDILNPREFRKNYLSGLIASGNPIAALKIVANYRNNTAVSGSDLTRLNLQNVEFENTRFELLNLSKSNFNQTIFKGCSFSGSDVSKSTFVGCDLQKARFWGTTAEGTDFSNSNLKESNFNSAKLKNAIFTGADLSESTLANATLIGADISDCKLTGAFLDKATYNETTKLPAGDFPQWRSLKWKGKGADPYKVSKKKEAASLSISDFPSFIQRIQSEFDKARISKAMSMLKKEKFQLFSDITSDSISGIVKSQTDAELFYACSLNSKGEFACCTQNLNPCGGLRGALCKHILVLVIGLTKANELSANNAIRWVASSVVEKPQLDRNYMAEVFIKYKGVESGEIDWRPTETMPEDYYVF